MNHTPLPLSLVCIFPLRRRFLLLLCRRRRSIAAGGGGGDEKRTRARVFGERMTEQPWISVVLLVVSESSSRSRTEPPRSMKEFLFRLRCCGFGFVVVVSVSLLWLRRGEFAMIGLIIVDDGYAAATRMS
ncbi:hypothetical protein AKJ16_DCAP09367 [Drosera capensis]